jgi:hypothetical protein
MQPWDRRTCQLPKVSFVRGHNVTCYGPGPACEVDLWSVHHTPFPVAASAPQSWVQAQRTATSIRCTQAERSGSKQAPPPTQQTRRGSSNSGWGRAALDNKATCCVFGHFGLMFVFCPPAQHKNSCGRRGICPCCWAELVLELDFFCAFPALCWRVHWKWIAEAARAASVAGEQEPTALPTKASHTSTTTP